MDKLSREPVEVVKVMEEMEEINDKQELKEQTYSHKVESV